MKYTPENVIIHERLFWVEEDYPQLEGEEEALYLVDTGRISPRGAFFYDDQGELVEIPLPVFKRKTAAKFNGYKYAGEGKTYEYIKNYE